MAERIDDHQLEQLRQTVEQQEDCGREGDFYRLTELDGQFHNQVVEATRKPHSMGFSR